MLRLPKYVAGMAKLAAKDVGRFALNGVRLTETEDGTIVEATDGKRAGILLLYDNKEESIGPLENAPNGAQTGMIPAADLAKIVREADEKKAWPKTLAEARLVLGRRVATFMVNGTAVFTVPLVDGRFPQMADVIPKKRPLASFAVSPKYLVDLLEVAAAITPEGEQRIVFQFWDADIPISIFAKGPGAHFFGLLMPLSGDKAPPGEERADLVTPPHPHAEPEPVQEEPPAKPKKEKKPKKSRKKKAAEEPPAEESPDPKPEETNGHLEVADGAGAALSEGEGRGEGEED